MATAYQFIRLCAAKKTLIKMLVVREIASRYKDTYLGIIWPLITPLILMALFSFVFTDIMKLKFQNTDISADVNYSLFIFLGLSVHAFFAETLGKMNTIIIDHQHYVKKIPFDTELLILGHALSALFHFLISIILIVILDIYFYGWDAGMFIYIPIIILPFFMITLGFAFIISCAAVFCRDLAQFMGPLFTGLLFCSTTFYPMANVPVNLQTLFTLNPITIPIEQLRLVIFLNAQPDFSNLGLSYIAGFLIFLFGFKVYSFYQRDFIDAI
ncbi:ABC transporter permease [Planktomarina temperata]|nr:ABC transporter permease [Planktomarina temperata]